MFFARFALFATTAALIGSAVAVGPVAISNSERATANKHLRVTTAERAVPNDNRNGVGQLVDGVFTVSLEARAVDWFPEDTTGPAVPVYAFAEPGKPATVPGPMIRVPVGTEMRVTLHNPLTKPLKVRGLYNRLSPVLDSIVMPVGATHVAQFRADVEGTFYYWGRTEGVPPIGIPGRGRDASLIGAFIVDPVGVTPRQDERILVITMWNDTAAALGIKSDHADAVLRREAVARNAWLLFAINGRSWPTSERLSYAVGDTVRWRVINGANFPHPMHLHGFHFSVDARGGPLRDTVFAVRQRRMVVTEWLVAGATMSMSWHAARPGNWLFHCHFVTHISDANAPVTRDAHTGHGNHAERGMAGLVLGVRVRPVGEPSRVRDSAPRRRLSLFITERANVYGKLPAYSYVLQEGLTPPPADSIRGAGSTITLRQNEPSEIRIRNLTKHATSIHWHGIELESFYDGVGDWSGWGTRVAPLIAPGDSFVVRITPPRAGTFIYHTHVNEGVDLASGLYGALVVLPQGVASDPRSHIVLFSNGGPHDEARPLVNGTTSPAPIEMHAGAVHRFRLINISPLESPTFQLKSGDSVLTWRAVAKDGADLPPDLATEQQAGVVVHPGETYDFEVIRPHADSLTLTVSSIETVAVREAARARGVPIARVPRIVTHVPVIVR
jgi:FtsP/CotA-like multicopper oxidase with cupredoxin domain